MWNYGKLSAKFLVSSVKVIDKVGFLSCFLSFTRTAIKVPLKSSRCKSSSLIFYTKPKIHGGMETTLILRILKMQFWHFQALVIKTTYAISRSERNQQCVS